MILRVASVAVLALLSLSPPQSQSDEIAALRREIQTLKAQQALMQRDLDTIKSLLPFEAQRNCNERDLESVLADSLYSGYLDSQIATGMRIHQHDGLRIPADIDFRGLSGLSHEMCDRLERTRPYTFGQARRIPGLTPAALATLLVHLSAKVRTASL